MNGETTPRTGRGPGFWAGLYLANVAVIGVLKLGGAINGPTGFILMALACVLLVPMIRTQAKSGCSSEALQVYNKRVVVSSIGYVLGLGIAITLWRNYEITGPVLFGLAMLPALPTLGIIWAMGRYLVDEKDEYLRHRTVMGALFGLGLVLTLGIFYGFLETFELVPHIWAWWVLPVWAIGLGIGQLWQKVREQ